MRVTEALRGIAHGERPGWKAERTLEGLMQLQGRTVNLLPVLQRKNIPAHLHYIPNSHPDQQPELESLRSAVLSERGIQFNNIDKLYEDYFTQQGIKASWMANIHNKDADPKILVIPQIDPVGVDPIWPAEKTIALFTMIDFRMHFKMLGTTDAQSRANLSYHQFASQSVTVNTTKVAGNLYEIDITSDRISHYQGRNEQDLRQTIRMAIENQTTPRNLQDEELDPDKFVLEGKAQKLMRDLLAARV